MFSSILERFSKPALVRTSEKAGTTLVAKPQNLSNEEMVDRYRDIAKGIPKTLEILGR